jgi:hypothetical protein
MTIDKKDTDLQSALNRANLNTLGDAMRLLGLGDMLRALPTHLRKKDPVANPYNLATLESVTTPEDAKGATILRATVRAGGVTGELTPQAFGVTPASGQIAVAPNGELVVLAADLITDVDVIYMPEKGDVVEVTDGVVTADVLTLSSVHTSKGVVLAVEVEATAGTATGKKIVLVPGAGAPAVGQARLNLAKTTVTFAGADVVTKARVKLIIGAAIDVSAKLEDTTTNIR